MTDQVSARLRGLLSLDLGAVDLRKGLFGLAAILAFGIFVAIFGSIGMVAAIAVLFVITADQPGSLRDRGMNVLIITLVGAVISLIGIWAGPEHVVLASLLTFVVVLLATLAAGFGPAMALRGMLLSVWTLLAISLAGEQENALQLAIAFAGGGAIAAAIVWLRARTVQEPSLEAEARHVEHSLQEILRSPLGWFALLRAAGGGVALIVGASLFPDHAIWAALTVVLVMKPRAGETLGVGLLRSMGTILGVIVAEMVIIVSGGDQTAAFIGFIVAAFGMTALQRVNYAVFVACLTALLVLAEQLATGSGEATAVDRLLATLVGAAIAFIGIAIGRLLRGKPVASIEPDPPRADEDPTPG